MTEKKQRRQAKQPDEERRSGAEPVLIEAAERRMRKSARTVQGKARAAVELGPSCDLSQRKPAVSVGGAGQFDLNVALPFAWSRRPAGEGLLAESPLRCR